MKPLVPVYSKQIQALVSEKNKTQLVRKARDPLYKLFSKTALIYIKQVIYIFTITEHPRII